jgi:hypothetical protein
MLVSLRRDCTELSLAFAGADMDAGLAIMIRSLAVGIRELQV